MATDPDVWPGTATLKNNMGIRDPERLSAIEAEVSHLALVEVTANGVPGNYDLTHLREFHRRIFSDIYPWAGEIRTVDIAKTGMFAHSPYIRPYLTEQFAKLANENYLRHLPRDEFTDRLTHYLAEVNAAHPFREGNGRTQRAFFGQLAQDAGYRVAWERLDAQRNIGASIAGHNGDNTEMRAMLDELVEQRERFEIERPEDDGLKR